MSTTQCLIRNRQSESITNLVVRLPVKEGQKLPVKEVLGYSWEEFQGLAWTVMEGF